MHIQYVNKQGEIVPSVTTVLKIINKPALIKWANYLGFKHKRVGDVLELAADMGTLVHFFVECIIMDYLPIINIPNYIDRGELKYRIHNFKLWREENELEPISCELSLSGKRHGGTIDYYGKVNGKYTIMDFKTSKSFYESMFIQLSGYILLMEEFGYKIDQVIILLLKPDKWEEKIIQRCDMELYIDTFKKALELYNAYIKHDKI